MTVPHEQLIGMRHSLQDPLLGSVFSTTTVFLSMSMRLLRTFMQTGPGPSACKRYGENGVLISLCRSDMQCVLSKCQGNAMHSLVLLCMHSEPQV